MRTVIFCLFSTFVRLAQLNSAIYPPYIGSELSQYYFQASGPWVVRHQNERVTGKLYFFGGWLEFSRTNGSWEAFLQENNSFEDCILQQAYDFLQNSFASEYHYYNVSILKTQPSEIIKLPIYYIDGEWHNNKIGKGVFRLYILSTIQKDSTYFLYVSVPKTSLNRERLFNELFNLIIPSHINRKENL